MKSVEDGIYTQGDDVQQGDKPTAGTDDIAAANAVVANVAQQQGAAAQPQQPPSASREGYQYRELTYEPLAQEPVAPVSDHLQQLHNERLKRLGVLAKGDNTAYESLTRAYVDPEAEKAKRDLYDKRRSQYRSLVDFAGMLSNAIDAVGTGHNAYSVRRESPTAQYDNITTREQARLDNRYNRALNLTLQAKQADVTRNDNNRRMADNEIEQAYNAEKNYNLSEANRKYKYQASERAYKQDLAQKNNQGRMKEEELQERKRANKAREANDRQRIAQGWARVNIAAQQASKGKGGKEEKNNVIISPAAAPDRRLGSGVRLMSGKKVLRYNNANGGEQKKAFKESAESFARTYYKEIGLKKISEILGYSDNRLGKGSASNALVTAAKTDPRFCLVWAAQNGDLDEFVNAFDLYREGWGLSDEAAYKNVAELTNSDEDSIEYIVERAKNK